MNSNFGIRDTEDDSISVALPSFEKGLTHFFTKLSGLRGDGTAIGVIAKLRQSNLQRVVPSFRTSRSPLRQPVENLLRVRDC